MHCVAYTTSAGHVLFEAEMAFREDAPFWQLGFRPFFLLGALFSVLAIGAWLLFLLGWAPAPSALDPIIWHAHEMVYGFSVAVVAGFVLTASQNWTGIRGLHGRKLQALTALWILARVLIWAFPREHVAIAIIDLLIYPVLALFLVPYLKDAELRVERIFFVYFALFLTGNLLVHLDALGVARGYALRGSLLGLYTIVIVIVFMGGRVIPFFTESSVAKAQPRTWPGIEALSHVTAWLFLVTQFFAPSFASVTLSRILPAGVSFAVALIHLVRLLGWQVRRVRRVPLIWVLHVSYLWIVIGFLLSGFSALGMIAAGAAIHAFTVGGIALMIYGMISRVSLGHTGRRLHPAAVTVAGYVLLLIAAVLRVAGQLVDRNPFNAVVKLSAVFWIAAFVILLAVYFPMLVRPRVDGKTG